MTQRSRQRRCHKWAIKGNFGSTGHSGLVLDRDFRHAMTVVMLHYFSWNSNLLLKGLLSRGTLGPQDVIQSSISKVQQLNTYIREYSIVTDNMEVETFI